MLSWPSTGWIAPHCQSMALHWVRGCQLRCKWGDQLRYLVSINCCPEEETTPRRFLCSVKPFGHGVDNRWLPHSQSIGWPLPMDQLWTLLRTRSRVPASHLPRCPPRLLWAMWTAFNRSRSALTWGAYVGVCSDRGGWTAYLADHELFGASTEFPGSLLEWHCREQSGRLV